MQQITHKDGVNKLFCVLLFTNMEYITNFARNNKNTGK